MTLPDRSSLTPVGWTAVAVARCRAIESARPDRWFDDPLAVHFVRNVDHSLPAPRPGLVAWVAVRTRFLDVLTMQAIDDGVRQVVIVASGLDARAFRLPLPPDTIVFEVDRSDVVDMKESLVEDAGLDPGCGRQTVIADILDPEWISRLADCGWDAGRSTLWILEGLLIYLEDDDRVRLLSQLSTANNSGRLGATLSTETGSMRHPLWRPAVEVDPEIWMSSSGWHARTETMAEASASFGRPLPTTANATRSWRLVSATVAGPQ